MEMNINTNTATTNNDNTVNNMEAAIITLQESAINGRRATLYQVESPLAPIYVVQYEKKDSELETEVFNHANRDKADKRYMAALKSMLKN